MFSGDQFKAFTDHGKDHPVPEPTFWPLYVLAAAFILAVVGFVVFG